MTTKQPELDRDHLWHRHQCRGKSCRWCPAPTLRGEQLRAYVPTGSVDDNRKYHLSECEMATSGMTQQCQYGCTPDGPWTCFHLPRELTTESPTHASEQR